MNIKKVIKAHGFTMKSVADSLGITLAALSQIASGNPSVKRLQEIADIIGVSLSELVSDESEEQTFIICPHCGERIKLSVEK